MNVFFIGYRCTGKTIVGKSLATFMDWPFVDTDALIVSSQNRSIDRIVEDDGWPVFRRMETKTLEIVCATDGQVVSTGGGIILNKKNVRLMRQTGFVVLLTATVETIVRRMSDDDQSPESRPKLTGEKDIVREISQTLIERMPLYRDAMNICMETDTRSVDEIIRGIASRLPFRSA